jgi:hypothetical protein
MGQASLKTPALNGWLPVKSNRTGAGAAEADPELRVCDLRNLHAARLLPLNIQKAAS